MTQPPSWPPPGAGQPDQPGYGTPPPPPYGMPPPGYGQPQYGQPQYGASPPGYGFAPYAALAPKPGIIPLRPLSVSEILDGAFSTIRRHPKATLGLSAIVACVQQGLSLGVRALDGSVGSTGGLTGLSFSSPNGSGSSTGADVARQLTATFGVLLVGLALTGVLTGMLCLVVSDSVLGHPSSAGAVWRRVRPLAPRVLGASLLVALCMTLGLATCGILSVFLYGAWALVLPALVLERIGILAAIKRSYRLATPSFWRVLGIRLLGKVITTAVAAPFAVITALFGAHDLFSQFNTTSTTTTIHISASTVIAAAVVSILVTTLTQPFVAGLLTLLYIDRRIRAEALDVQLQQAALAAPGGAAVPVPVPPVYG